MRAVDPALQAHLDGGATTLCDCWIITRADGARVGVTTHDGPLTVDGVTCAPQADARDGVTESALGMAADNVELIGALSASAITVEDMAAGLYDGAEARRLRVNWRNPSQRLETFRGAFAAVTVRGDRYAVEVLSAAEALNRALGRVYLGTCDARLGDARCGVDLERPDRRATGAVIATPTAGVLVVSGLEAIPEGALAHGVLRWLNGPGRRTARIREDAAENGGRRLTLDAAPDPAPPPGAAVAVEVGCDRTLAACAGRFDNVLRFRGFPHLPGDDWLTAAPAPGGVHDGGARDG